MRGFQFKSSKSKVSVVKFWMSAILIIVKTKRHTIIFRNLFPCGDNLVCIIDDRQDVWDFAPNFVNVKPYYVFLCGLKKPSKHFAIRNKLHSNVIIDPEDVYKSASCAKQQEDDVVASLDESLAIGLQENELKKQVTTSKTTLDDNSCKTLENSDERGSSLETVVECSTTLIGDKIDEDADNYFSFLTNILTRIHKRFYKLHDNYIRQNCQELISEHYHLPDLKTIIPSMSKRVLRGVNIIFSGVHPIREPLERSRLYQVALSLGARVQRRLVAKTKDNEDEATSHVVAARQGTSKVKEAKRLQGIHVVNPGWLWRCAELWEKADEEKFPVIEDTSLRTASSVQPEVPSNLSTEENVNESKNSSVKKSYQETNHGDVIV